MTTKSLEEAIAAANHDLAQARASAEELVSSYQEVVAQTVVDLAQSMIDRSVTSNPAITTGLGADRLKAMKIRFRTMVETLPDLVRTTLMDDRHWPHRSGLPTNLESIHSVVPDLQKQHADALNETLRQSIGEAGAILIDFGYAGKAGQGEWEVMRAGPPRYRYGLSTNGTSRKSDLEDLKNRYKVALQIFVTAARSVMAAEKAKASAEAKSLWDDA